MLPKNAPIKYSINVQSPFKKVENIGNNFPKNNNSNQILYPNLSRIFQEKHFNVPVHFGLNFYFSQPKNSYYQPQIYSQSIKPQEIIYPNNYNPESIPSHIMFKNSLAKSGYRLNQDQFVQFKEDFIRPNNININNNMKNNNYNNLNYCSINNNNIINNIYPTFTRDTNVQILSDNEKTKLNENKKDIKKDNINLKDVVNKEENINTNKEENININNNKKVMFECSETNENTMDNKILLKKKRYRKNREQLGLLSKYYKENKNWSKNKIKEISEIVGLKENKIYKWLWDQKNKEFKGTKFVINK